MEDGKKFTIIAHNNSHENVYIQSATLNGKLYTRNYINYTDIVNGGTLTLEMSNVPNTSRGILDADKPFSLSALQH
jgi:putative alpha-1,2-mannosidase